MSFGEWLRQAVARDGVTVRDLEDSLGVSNVIIYKHLCGQTYPSLYTLYLYAEYFDECVENLLELCEDGRIYDIYVKGPRNKFGIWLRDMLLQNTLTVEDVANKLRVSNATIYRHLYGNCVPSLKMIKKYADLFTNGDWMSIYPLTLPS